MPFRLDLNTVYPFLKENIFFDMSAAEGTALYRILKENSYENETTAVIYFILKKIKPKLFLDVGANIGFYSALVKKIDSSISVIAIEPSPSLSKVAKNFCISNDVRVDVKTLALGEKKGRCSFYISKSDCSNSLREGFREAKEIIDVDVDTINSLLVDYNPEACLLKVDTETTEGDVLLGGSEWINKNRPFIICEVLYGLEDPRIPIFLKNINYFPYQILKEGIFLNENVNGEITYKQRDYLFSPEVLTSNEINEINSIIRSI